MDSSLQIVNTNREIEKRRLACGEYASLCYKVKKAARGACGGVVLDHLYSLHFSLNLFDSV